MGSLSNVEDRVATFIEDILKVQDLHESFNLFLIHRPDLEEAKREQWMSDWVSLLAECSAMTAQGVDSSAATSTSATGGTTAVSSAAPTATNVSSLPIELALKTFVSAMASKRAANPRIMSLMASMLERAVNRHIVSSRQVCDALLTSEHLKYEKADLWVTCFKLVRKIVGGVDYKGVREIMKICIEKVIVASPSSLSDAQMASIHQLLSYIFDRNAALLPGYFIVNEILKSYPDNPSWPHWTLVPMVSSFVSSFRPTAQMVSSMLKHRMRPVVEQTGKAHVVSSWKVDSHSLKFILKGSMTYDRILPYDRELMQPQKELLAYILRQLYSKELVSSVMGIQKPRKDSTSPVVRYAMLEEQLVALFVFAMQESEQKGSNPATELLWWNTSSQLIFFLLYNFVSFGSFVDGVFEAVVQRGLKCGRDHLMFSLLQFVSGSLTKSTISEMMPVLKLFILYDEDDPLPVPDIKDKSCARRLAATAIYMHLAKKAKSPGCEEQLSFALPVALQDHFDFLLQLSSSSDMNVAASLKTDYLPVLICNTFSTCQDIFQGPLSAIVRCITGCSNEDASTAGGANEVVAMPGKNCVAFGASEPLSIDVLDALSVHSKISLIHSFVNHVSKHINNSKMSMVCLSPALVETYSRLLVYSEIESLGIKGLLNQILPQVFKQGAWGVLHTLLEVFCYRLHHTQAHFRLSLLSHLQMGLVTGSHTVISKNPQLNICIESTTLKLITGLGNAELAPPKGQTAPAVGKASTSCVLYGESEELNRVVVLTLARAIHINGMEQQTSAWVKDVLTNIMNKTPHSWPSHTLVNFPPLLQEFFKENPGPKENKAQLKKTVEDEYKTWSSMSNEHDIVQHFSNPNNSIFLCVVWKMLLDSDQISPVAYKVLERIGAKQLTVHLRAFCDVLVCEFSKSGGSGHVNRCIAALSDLIWKYHIIALDRLILCMALRTHEGNDAQVCFFIIQLLLLKPQEFRNRVSELVKTMSPEYHLLKDFHAKHLEFNHKFPESCVPNEFSASSDSHTATLPVYFGNVCLRFIPVFDMVVHRFLELPPVSKSLETLIDHVGVLYKFHDRPISFLYNTLHYYEARLRDRTSLKKKLISSIVGALKDVRPQGWSMTNPYLDYLYSDQAAATAPDAAGASAGSPDWTPGLEYYVALVGRMVQAMQEKRPFPFMDWRFNEFPNEGCHALYVTCVEVMGLPVFDPSVVGGHLLDVVLKANHLIRTEDMPDWINAIGLLFASLPDSFVDGLSKRLVSVITTAPLSQWNLPQSIFDVLNYDAVCGHRGVSNATTGLVYLLALAHSIWHHSGFAQIQQVTDLVREKLVPLVRTEEQLIFVYHLAGPVLQRLQSERFMRPLFDLTVLFYRMLAKVDKEVQHLKHMDAICDILYHFKYQFTGDSIKADALRVVKDLRPALQLRLQFISPTNLN